jgi:23S rRNA pseudouridine1911/1915/1917 synthase
MTETPVSPTTLLLMQNIEILYEDKDIVAVNKPAGLVVHSDGKTQEETLTDWVLKKYPDSADVGEPGRTSDGKTIDRPGIVHRLDRETSGVMLVAKTKAGFDCLKKQFQEHEVKKEYHAFVYGKIKDDKGVIDRPIGRSKKDFRMWSAQRGARGEMREAVTEYEVKEKAKDYSFVHVFPKTGRTHQIRVHFKAINYPLVCDSLYASGRANSLSFTRLALHSYRVTFTRTNGEIETVTAPHPDDFVRALLLLQS